jgi:thiol-disulfide isomerase/thioredoxin
MSRFVFPLMIVVCLISLTASCQAENRKPLTFENATTVEQIEAQAKEFTQKQRLEITDLDSFKKILPSVGETNIAGGEKILKIAKNDEEQEKGYELKIFGLKLLIQKDTQLSPHRKSQHQDKLNTLIDTLEKEGKCLRLVNGERFWEFANGLQQLEWTPEKFEQIKKDIRHWVNKQPIPFEPTEPLKFVLQFAELEILSKNNPEIVSKTVQEFIAFVQSSECTISDAKKKETIKRLEGYSLRYIGSDLKLYGKMLDNKDFDWNALRGKYVLVKFTASWCGPCRGEIPNMLKAYKQYHDKGFEIVSVYIWDSLADTKQAVEEEKLPWLIVSEELTEKAKQPPQGETYNIRGVPTMLLIDKDGKVIEDSIRGQQLQTRLAELFQKKN